MCRGAVPHQDFPDTNSVVNRQATSTASPLSRQLPKHRLRTTPPASPIHSKRQACASSDHLTMPYFKTAQEWLDQSRLLLEARPSTVRPPLYSPVLSSLGKISTDILYLTLPSRPRSQPATPSSRSRPARTPRPTRRRRSPRAAASSSRRTTRTAASRSSTARPRPPRCRA